MGPKKKLTLASTLAVEEEPPRSTSPAQEFDWVWDMQPAAGLRVGTIDEIKKLGAVGRGAGGIVHKCLHVPSNTILAVKEVNVTAPEKQKEIVKELGVLYNNTCPSIVAFHGVFVVDSSFQILIEYMDHGSLADILQRTPSIPQNILANIVAQVLVGLDYLHKERHQLHRDIKPSNILCNSAGQAKLADFGVASAQLANSFAAAATFAGTVRYMAPERLKAEGHTYASDMWSLGITIAECALGEFPYKEIHARSRGNGASFWDIIDAVQNTSPNLPHDRLSPDAIDFITATLNQDPAKRPSARQLMGHAFVRGAGSSTADVAAWLQTIDKHAAS